MTMIRFTYDDGVVSATVIWTPEYGFVAAGSKEVLSAVTFDMTEPRVVDVPVLAVPMRPDVPTPPAEAQPKPKCYACNHPWHTAECTRKVEGIPCGCTEPVP